MRLYKILAILLFSFSWCSPVLAQTAQDSIAVYGNVSDHFTYEKLKDVRIEIMRPDSSLIEEFHTGPVYRYGGYPHNIDKVGYLYIPRTTCIFRFSKEGYVTKTVCLDKKDIYRREKRMFLGEILLRKKAKSHEKELGEAVVTASKIRMIVKGDTLVYHADAFQLAEGSMLDGLIKRLPGFELRGGQIRVNGEYVSSLLVNGEDFFRGDPRVALENLPAYMVDKVKVYHKEHEYSYITKEKDKNELPLVVDVNLKRQYAIGWVANAGAGYGLEDRYSARLFTLRFTDNSRLVFYGNANNTNDTREPGVTSDWNAQGTVSGRTDMQTGGFEALVKDKKGVWKYTGNAKVTHRKTDDRSATSTETFQPGLSGSTFSRIRNENEGRDVNVRTTHQLTLRKQSNHLTIDGEGSYRKTRNHTNRLGAEFMDNPKDAYRAASLDSIFMGTSERLAALLIHKQRELYRSTSDTWNGNVRMNSFMTIPHTPDYLHISAHVQVEKNEAVSFSDYTLSFNPLSGTSGNDYRLRYTTSPAFSLDAGVHINYTFRPDWGFVKPHYDLKENYHDADHSLYRLDRLGDEIPAFGELPSSVAALMNCLDAPNSYTSRLNTQSHHIGTDLGVWIPGKLPSHRITIHPEVEWHIDHLVYHRDRLHTKPYRSKAVFTPSASWGFEDCYINYKLTSSFPDLLSMTDYTDNANPLSIYQGNPDLKRSTRHAIDFTRSFSNYRTGWHLYLTGGWNLTRNAIAHAMNYDTSTGVRTYSPRNVNGNWETNLSGDYQKPLDKKQHFILSSITDIKYRNSVDYVTERSSVRNLNVRENLRLNTRIKQYTLDLDIAARYLHATSHRACFEDINSFDFKYCISAQIPLPAGFSFSTDLTLYHRTGYTDASLNDCHFVANARLSKTFLGGRLGLTLDAFDIFHGLNNVTKVINAQGITETWHNSLPSYALLQIVYKFSKQPRRNNP